MIKGRLCQQRLGETFQVVIGRYHHLIKQPGKWLNDDVHEWLDKEIGFENWERTVGAQIKFYFKYEEDKVKFILRWL